MSRWSHAFTVLLLVTLATPAWAQRWSTELQFGRIRSTLDPAATAAQSVVAGLRFEAVNTQLRVMAGVPTTSAEPLWGAAAIAQRVAARRGVFVGGVDLGANGFFAHDRSGRETGGLPGPLDPRTPAAELSGHALAGQVAPVAGIETQHVHMHGRVGVAIYRSEFGASSLERDARFGDVQLTLAPTASVALVPAAKHMIVRDTGYTFVGLTGIAAVGQVTLWGNVGEWLDLDETATTWAAGASARVHDRLTITGSTRRDTRDPFYPTAPHTGWNLGVQLHLGARPGGRAPVPASYVNGQATIRLPLSQARSQPRVAGDFNGWQPQPMQRTSDAWVYTVALAPGVYNYAFVDERGEWFVPEKHAGRKEDGMGGHVAVLVVQP